MRGEILEFEEHTLKTDPYTENKGLDRRLDCSNEDETSAVAEQEKVEESKEAEATQVEQKEEPAEEAKVKGNKEEAPAEEAEKKTDEQS